MNERIKELFEQALEEFNAENKYATIIVPNPLKEKFAELIIKDCIEAIQNESMALNVDEFEHGLRIAEGAILDHFGVEE